MSGFWRTCLLALTFLAGPSLAATVGRVDFEGFNQVPIEQVRHEFPLHFGDNADQESIDAACDWLRRLGLFISVTATTRAGDNGTVVLFKVVENPPVAAVLIDGTGDISTAALRGGLETKPQTLLDRVLIARDSQYIAAEYRKIGLVAEVDVSFDPPPTHPTPPVEVHFKIYTLRVGTLRAEPLNYVQPEALAPYWQLKVGDALALDSLVRQQRRLAEMPLLAGVGEPTFRPDKRLPDGQVELTFPTTEADRPILVEETLPSVDLERLRQWVRFDAVGLNVNLDDLEVYHSSQEITDADAAARAAALAHPGDVEAGWRRLMWARISGTGVEEAVKALAADLVPRLQSGQTTPLEGLRAGQLALLGGNPGDAVMALEKVVAAKPPPMVAIEAYREELNALGTLVSAGDETAAQRLPKAACDGAEALRGLPDDVSLDDLTQAFQFYFTAMSMARQDAGMKFAFRLDSPAAGALLHGVYNLGGRLPPLDDADPARRREAHLGRQHLGKLLTGLGFVAHSVGGEVAGDAPLKQFDDLLGTAREAFLAKEADVAEDPLVSYFLALNDLLTGNLEASRGAVLAGLNRYPLDERLLDLYVVSCLENLYSNLTAQQAPPALQAAVTDLSAQRASGRLHGWGPALLTAKLALGLREALPRDQAEAREAARQTAEAAARAATEAEPEQASGWWILGLAVLKGPDPKAAIPLYQRCLELRPDHAETRYALALAYLVSGQTAEGIKAMHALQPPVEPIKK